MNIAKALENKTLTSLSSTMAKTVIVTTALKAVGRPAFIYADKKSDAETKKYTAGKEFLYQLLCLGLTLIMLKGFKKGGQKLAENLVNKKPDLAKSKEYILKGGTAMGDLVGSVLGLTIVAPLLSHEILHPIMHALGMEKKQDKNVGQPTEIFLADRKNPAEKENKISLNA